MKTVLIVEDDRNIANSIKIRLSAMGFVAIASNDAVYAMDAYKKYQPDVVLLDVNLPGGDGFLLAERIMNASSTTTPALIFISASKDPKFQKRATEFGAVFLEKPFEPHELSVAIQDGLC
jgi:DNA-binding response OmpR family regulator